MDHALKWIYISCKIQHTENNILYEIIKQVDPETKVPMKGFSLDYYSVLWKVIKENNLSLVVVLDEIDYLIKDYFLYNISRAGESKFVNNGHFISPIGI
jgi:Cdc6-like AAA superfamily ATPase